MKEVLALLKQNYGIEISIPTVSGLSPYIQSQGVFGKNCSLMYNSVHGGFMVSTVGTWINTKEDARQFAEDLHLLYSFCETLNEKYKPIPLKK